MVHLFARSAEPVKNVGGSLRRPTVEWVAVTVLCVSLAVASAIEGWLWRIDQTIYDGVLTSWVSPPSDQVVIVSIDDASLASLGRWPWSRRIHAALIDRAREVGAAAVMLDVLLDAPSRDDPAADEALARAMRDYGRVVLPLSQATTGSVLSGEVLPLPLFADAAAALGHDQLEFDPDGIARSVYLWEGFGTPRYPQLALALLRVVDPTVRKLYSQPTPREGADAQQWQRAGWLRIRFSGAPGSYIHYSYRAVLNGEVPAAALRGKLLLVGATASGMAEAVPTPTSGLSRSMPGIEFQANVYDALHGDGVITPLPSWVAALVAGLMVGGLMLVLLYADARIGLMTSFALAAAALLLAALGVTVGGWWFGPASAVGGCMLAYPLWSWRRLEAAQRYLDAELIALEREGSPIGLLPDDEGAAADPLEQRIRIVRQVAQHQRDVRRFIADTLEHLPIGVVVIDQLDRVILHNERARYLLRAFRSDALLAALRELPWPVYVPMRDGLPDLSGFSGIRQFELTPDKKRYLLVSVADLVTESSGRPGRVIGLADVTAMHEAQRSREDTMHFLSHDLRAPLASILTLIDGQQGGGTPDWGPQIPRIARYARSALDLADGLFRLVRAEGSDPKDFVELDLAGLVDSAADEVWPQAQARGIRVEVDTRDAETEEAIVRGDFSLLRRAVINLLTNAIKYGAANSTVSVRLSAEGPDWVIRVSDQGAGIPPDALPRLFKRFSRIVEEGRDKPTGVGLGLLIVKTVAERHGGAVNVQSTLGQGSTFELRLPLRNATALPITG
ncbi:CHASE2 domain-containing protein [Zoogloea sp.]|uniref:CHASE2 domain-containing protein n=1 Tax=Zoogloea sp. TaxID=49181 RepID=UPI0035B2FDA6